MQLCIIILDSTFFKDFDSLSIVQHWELQHLNFHMVCHHIEHLQKMLSIYQMMVDLYAQPKLVIRDLFRLIPKWREIQMSIKDWNT